MQSTYLKLGLLVSALHVTLFIAIAHPRLQPLYHGIRSAKPSQVIELRSAAPQYGAASQPKAEPKFPKALAVVHPPTVHGDSASIVAPGSSSELMSARITPPSADVHALHNPKPPYPISSRENGEQGAVMLYACITDHGKVERVDLAQSSGYPALDRSALNTIRHWSFRPAQESGKSIPMCYRLPIRFLLSSSALSILHS
jgi:protein TonB